MVREIYLQVQWYFCLSVPSLNKVVWSKHLLLEVDFSRCGPYLVVIRETDNIIQDALFCQIQIHSSISRVFIQEQYMTGTTYLPV